MIVTNRQAIIIGCWETTGRLSEPSETKIRKRVEEWKILLTSHGFSSFDSRYCELIGMLNPHAIDVVQLFNGDFSCTTENTELLLYFVGHGESYGDKDLHLILGVNQSREHISESLNRLLERLYRNTKVKNVIMIIDSCFSSRACDLQILDSRRDTTFVMTASNAYAYNCSFSDYMLEAFKIPSSKKAELIDKFHGGITYERLFEYARGNMLKSKDSQIACMRPKSSGNYGSHLFIECPVVTGNGYRDDVSKRSIYGRIYTLLQFIQTSKMPTYDVIDDFRCNNPIFIINSHTENDGRCVSKSRLDDYLEFLERVNFIHRTENGIYFTTELGNQACLKEKFNGLLLSGIESDILKFRLSDIDNVIKSLLRDMLVPTPSKIRNRALMNGKLLPLDNVVRLAFHVLPMTGRFLRGSDDTIFPPDLLIGST
jgi:Peptidase C13 family